MNLKIVSKSEKRFVVIGNVNAVPRKGELVGKYFEHASEVINVLWYPEEELTKGIDVEIEAIVFVE